MAEKGVAGRILGGLFELVSWIPFLLVLSALGAASLTEEMVDYPDWILGSVNFYRDTIYPLTDRFLDEPEPWIVDAGFVGLGLFSLAARALFPFLVSVVAFLAFAALFGFGANSFF
ncbi:MAG: hypothetical protein HXY25_04275 [Alphaproteobacteria bacterium]|nr:hypothetical protein [Alphaproteobacteria bacterium]